MKARVPKEYAELSPKQKERLRQYCIEVATEAAKKQEDNDCRVILNLYMKMVCVTLHDAFGFGKKRLTMFLGNHRRLFAKQARLVRDGEQLEYLDKRIKEIFKNDFPQEFVDGLIGKVESDNLIEED